MMPIDSNGRNRTTRIATATPSTPAKNVATTDSMNTAKNTRPADAPRARRMPISRTRWRTVTMATLSSPSAPRKTTIPPITMITVRICPREPLSMPSRSPPEAVPSQPGPSTDASARGTIWRASSTWSGPTHTSISTEERSGSSDRPGEAEARTFAHAE